MRAHIILPDELIREIDAVVGKRGRSAFLIKAAEERLQRERLRRAMKAAVGSIKARDYPQWATSRKAASWVRRLRRESKRRLPSTN